MAQRGVKSRGDADIPDVTGRFEAVAKALLTAPGVSQSAKRGFGFSGLLVGGKLFAVPRAGELLVKLPAAKVAALIASGDGAPFVAGRGRVMREWVTVKMTSKERWLDLARQAMQFGARSGSKGA